MLSRDEGRTSCPCVSQADDAFEMGKQTSVNRVKKNGGDFKASPLSKQFLSVSSIQTIPFSYKILVLQIPVYQLIQIASYSRQLLLYLSANFTSDGCLVS